MQHVYPNVYFNSRNNEIIWNMAGTKRIEHMLHFYPSRQSAFGLLFALSLLCIFYPMISVSSYACVILIRRS
jgi:hypothetical protein